MFFSEVGADFLSIMRLARRGSTDARRSARHLPIPTTTKKTALIICRSASTIDKRTGNGTWKRRGIIIWDLSNTLI
jgi:hypothetical protein